MKTITLQAGIPTPSDPSAEALLEAIVEAISRCFQDAPDKESFSSEIPISVASYIDEKGQPERRGFVGQLYDLGSDIPALISQEVRRKVFNQEQVYVVLSHDGRASARSFAGSSHTTTIILGSALSFGIPPISRKSIIPASDDFALKMT